ncbi:hypothetical protein SUNI508_14049 [Seiridium unicorne]|uniref:Uncharacterized protein n=1 Tax=Seiridium unicorne TaxID=138068 RepID=A0ABR2V8N5_9PEZI
MADDPLARENLSTLKALQAEGQQVGSRGYHMQLSGFFHWGFVVYRCDYTDDELWARFIARLRHEVDAYMGRNHEDRTTGPYLEWTIIEDRESLDRATKEQVRELFRTWRRGLSVERDGPGADNPLTTRLPRFEYCVHIGDDSLSSLLDWEKYKAGGGRGRGPPVKCALVSVPAEHPSAALSASTLEDEGGESDESEDLSDGHDIRWMYIPLDSWVVAYEELHIGHGWDLIYKRPPEVGYW